MALFILFSVVPLGFITGFSFVKYEEAIDNELTERLRGNAREIKVILEDFQQSILQGANAISRNNELKLALLNDTDAQSVAIVKKWATRQIAHRISFFNRNHKMLTSLLRADQDRWEEDKSLGANEIFLNDSIVKSLLEHERIQMIDNVGTKALELIVYTRISDANGNILGTIEELLTLDQEFLLGLKKRMNLEFLLLDQNERSISATTEDLLLLPEDFFRSSGEPSKFSEHGIELKIQDVPLQLQLHKLRWGEKSFVLGIGAYKKESQRILKEVKYAFFTVTSTVMILLSITSLVTSRMIATPFRQLIDAIHAIEQGKPFHDVANQNIREFAVLTESVNRMGQATLQAQQQLKHKIGELESTNLQLKDAQSQLVHSEKMAGLGQLVAGIAHELNNPIGFIYSNVGHLKDYCQRLFRLLDIAQTAPQELKQNLIDAEYDYLKEDLPRLISSCEDGSRRIRDIVLGLRNFSRMDSSRIERINLNQCIEDTLLLLAGEFKDRITVHKDFEPLPLVLCYPTQLSQVFMNLLTNASAAISAQGNIWIKSRSLKNKVEISIKDDGVGIPDEIKSKIFDPFFTTKEVGKGTGLGLSISYGIVERHNGTIEVHSEPGKGSEFVVSVPIRGLEHGKGPAKPHRT